MGNLTLKANYFYEHYEGHICCGQCWSEDMAKPYARNSDEIVRLSDLTQLDNNKPQQCDNCGKQNEAYERGEFN